jgi:hypothetical protein
VNFVIAFVVVLILIAAAAWLVRRFGAARLDSAARGRQPRLAVIDSAAVDGRRKLVIVRRDNVEHLLMIGGPSDVVVETNIVRAAALPTRDAPAVRNGAAPAIDPTPWPLQPEPAPAPAAPVYAPPPAPPSAPPLAPTVRAERAPRTTAAESWPEPAEPVAPAPPVRASRPAETLAGLADELAQPQPAREPARHPAPPVVATGASHAPPVADQSLAEMAQRLEAALRRPAARRLGSEAGGGRVTVIAESKSATREPRLAVAASKDSAAAPPAQTSAPAPPRTPTNSDLEQEMATLLGRPGKT